MERGSLSGLKRRPAEEERGGTRDAVDSFWDNAERLNPDNKKRTCRRIDAGLGENELAQACWITDWGSESKGFIAQECLPGNLQGRQSSVIAADNGRRPTQPCSRCLAGESKSAKPQVYRGRRMPHPWLGQGNSSSRVPGII